jgi:hypothetical protein
MLVEIVRFGVGLNARRFRFLTTLCLRRCINTHEEFTKQYF